ncbi:TPA: phage tail protein [Enterococcus faecalis]|uniref:phage tail tube protein n=1 Tax=Enterococcus faecalis TaxID=1351 RepID=UPI0036D57B62
MLLKMDIQMFARNKNAKREHYIAEYTPGEEVAPTENTKWLRLAKFISGIGDDTNEETDDTGFYDGDGTPETTVTSVAGSYTPEGFWDPEDPAQALIESKKYLTGEGRKVWHKVIQTNGKTYVGRATVTGIKAGAGDATTYEEFGCTITFDALPTIVPKT